MSTHGGYSFPGHNTLFGRVHRVSRSPFLRSDGSSLRSCVPVPRPLVPVIRPLLTDSSHPPLFREKRPHALTPGIIYTIIFNTLVRRMPVLKTLNRLNLISTVRGGTKTLLKLLTMRRGPSPVCLVRASFLSYVPFVTLKSFYK